MLKAVVGGVELEIWFTPSFNIKTTDKRLEAMLRASEFEVFDPLNLQTRKVRATKSIRDAYLVLYRIGEITKVKVEFKEIPELPNSYDQGTEENPVLH